MSGCCLSAVLVGGDLHFNAFATLLFFGLLGERFARVSGPFLQADCTGDYGLCLVVYLLGDERRPTGHCLEEACCSCSGRGVLVGTSYERREAYYCVWVVVVYGG